MAVAFKRFRVSKGLYEAKVCVLRSIKDLPNSFRKEHVKIYLGGKECKVLRTFRVLYKDRDFTDIDIYTLALQKNFDLSLDLIVYYKATKRVVRKEVYAIRVVAYNDVIEVQVCKKEGIGLINESEILGKFFSLLKLCVLMKNISIDLPI